MKIRNFVSMVLKHRQAIFGLLVMAVVSFFIGFICSEDNIPSTKDADSTALSETTAECVESTYTQDELFCMAAAIYNEAGGDACSDETRFLVGYVILNRVNDSRYPDTIREVLEQKDQYGRFYYTGIKFADRGESYWESYAQDRAYQVAEEVLKTRNNIPIPPTVVFQSEHKQGVSVYKYQDGLYFCYAEEVN